jgi:endonuclease YncB( thermonuclease family)
MRKPAEFETHPVSFADAMRDGKFRGVVKRVHDGDTYSVFIDEGFFDYAVKDIRLADVNTPEVVGVERAAGMEAQVFAASLLLEQPIVLRTQMQSTGSERMTFDRYVADVWIIHAGGTQESVASLIRAAGFDKLHPL